MDLKEIDNIDRQMIKLLSEDGRMPAKDIATKLNVSAPTIHSRLNSLESGEGYQEQDWSIPLR